MTIDTGERKIPSKIFGSRIQHYTKRGTNNQDLSQECKDGFTFKNPAM